MYSYELFDSYDKTFLIKTIRLKLGVEHDRFMG